MSVPTENPASVPRSFDEEGPVFAPLFAQVNAGLEEMFAPGELDLQLEAMADDLPPIPAPLPEVIELSDDEEPLHDHIPVIYHSVGKQAPSQAPETSGSAAAPSAGTSAQPLGPLGSAGTSAVPETRP